MSRNITIISIFLLYFLQLSTETSTLHAQTFQLDTILYNGDPNKFINFVFMGDGYQNSQLGTYKSDVQNVTDYLFTISPFSEYKNYFNVFAIRVPSAQSGVKHPKSASDCPDAVSHPQLSVTTYFNSTFDYYSIHRLLVPQNSSAINSVLINNFPLYDQKLMLVNSPYYGGSGGSTTTSSLHSSAYEIMVHEIGHSFAGLADEYYAGDVYANEDPNMTKETNAAFVKWKNWIGVDGVGIYQHCCGGNSATWYRPHNNCKMRYLGTEYPFCPVCRETIVKKVHQLFNTPIVSHQPNETSVSYCNQPLHFELSTVSPLPNTLQIKWKLNGNEVEINNNSVTISHNQLNTGNNILSVYVKDTTSFVRDNSHTVNYTYQIDWTINNSIAQPAITVSGETTFCQGDSVVLTSSTADAYLWNNGETTQSITTSTAGNYLVTTTNSIGCSATSLPEMITTNTVDTSVTLTDATLSSNAIQASYQWVTCPTMQIVDGETDQTFSPTQNGDYAVIVTQNNCADTSNCYIVNTATTSLLFVNTSSSIIVYPNPTSEFLTIKSKGLTDSEYKITLANELGLMVYENLFDVKDSSLDYLFNIGEFSSGVYFLSITSKTIHHVFKIIKQ